ncbi:MAG: GC-type dockerin domain-anchored protein [Phycisphaerales bacterium JB037]
MAGKMSLFASALSLVSLSGLVPLASADVPTYRVEVVAPIAVSTTLTGASEAGHMVGWQVIAGQVRGFVATVDDGIVHLPLPDGYLSSTALDVNSDGVVVGAVATNGFPYDLGEPAIWVPDGAGGYTVHIPDQFASLPSPLGTLPINGGMAVAINDAGTIVGWSRYQGFQGGPSTRFFLSGAPVNLGALGFDATVEDLNGNDVAVGGQVRFDLTTNTATDLGIPAPASGVSFTLTIGYAINDSNEVVAAARRATSTADRWLTYLHDPIAGWSPLNPAQIPGPFVGFYDNNNLGDVSATGGLLFAPEGVLITSGVNSLIDPADANWSASLGFLGNDRRMYTSATDANTGDSSLVILVPIAGVCPADLTGASDPNDASFGVPDGDADGDDFFFYLDAFGSGDLAVCDLTGSSDPNDPGFGAPDGDCDGDDFFRYLGLFEAGCP